MPIALYTWTDIVAVAKVDGYDVAVATPPAVSVVYNSVNLSLVHGYFDSTVDTWWNEIVHVVIFTYVKRISFGSYVKCHLSQFAYEPVFLIFHIHVTFHMKAISPNASISFVMNWVAV